MPPMGAAVNLVVVPGLGKAESPEPVNTGLWNMDSGLALRAPRSDG
jgi:hypothetical protein